MSNYFDRLASNESEPIPEHNETAAQPTVDISKEHATTTSTEVKMLTQELLKSGRIDESEKPDLFKRTIVREKEILAVLEPLDLSLRLDTHRGIAFLVIAESAFQSEDGGEIWSHPLVRRQRLTLEQSLLVAVLRQIFVMHEQEVGIGQSAAKVPVDDLLPQFLTYFGESGSDSRDVKRLENLLEQLKVHGVVSEIDDKHEVTIRPMIAHLANPESLNALLSVLQRKAAQANESVQGGE